MNLSSIRGAVRAFAAVLVTVGVSAPAVASTINQNTSWTIDRAGTTTKYRVVASGAAIYAGYRGSVFNVAKKLSIRRWAVSISTRRSSRLPS